MRRIVPIALAAALTAASAHAAPTTIRTAQGVLGGEQQGGIEMFKGIRYAAPPVGPLRWRPPQPVASWQGIRDARAYGDDCPQNRFPFDSTPSHQPMSEDCLYLNVWAPADGKAHPVMVWIHGGALTTGSGASPVFDGSTFARKGIVLVTINYRLGRLGFFAHPALAAEHPGEPVGDYGLMDQIAALKWVRANIAAFGGDSHNVTIFGQSSGGSSVLHLMIEPDAHGLFAKAICESGGGREPWARLDRAVEGKTSGYQAGLNFAHGVGIDGADAKAANALRALPTKAIVGDVGFWNAESSTYSGPMVDGELVPDDVSVLFREGKQARVPLLIGATDDELGAVPDAAITAMTAAIRPKFGARAAGLSTYYGPGKSRPADLFDDAGFVEPARYMAEKQAATGAPVWLYRFAYVPVAKRKDGHGAGHASELPFVFGTIDQALPSVATADRTMSEAIQDSWIAFARSGDPDGDGPNAWPRYHGPQDAIMIFGNDDVAARPDPSTARLDYIAESYPEGQR